MQCVHGTYEIRLRFFFLCLGQKNHMKFKESDWNFKVWVRIKNTLLFGGQWTAWWINFTLFVINMTIDYEFSCSENGLCLWNCWANVENACVVIAIANVWSHLFLVTVKLFLVLFDVFVAFTTKIFQQLCDIRCTGIIEVLLGTFLQSRKWCDRFVCRMTLGWAQLTYAISIKFKPKS